MLSRESRCTPRVSNDTNSNKRSLRDGCSGQPTLMQPRHVPAPDTLRLTLNYVPGEPSRVSQRKEVCHHDFLPHYCLHALQFQKILAIIMADTEVAPAVSFKKRIAKATARKRPATPPPASDSDSDFTSSENESGRQIKRRRKNAGAVTASTSDVIRPVVNDHTSTSESVVVRHSNLDNATKRSDWYDDEHDKAHVKQQQQQTPPENDGTYKGAANYQSFIQKNPDRQTNVGPQKLNSNVRTITVTDFAPDVCKDYKQTGFCGFGDSCKFLHAREDYKQGWQLDRDWEINTKGKKLAGRTVASADRNAKNTELDEDDEKLLESIPFACIICKKPYSNPIITKCNHYFCEACALKRYRKDPSCANCGTGTGGVFNVAKKLNRLLEKKRERQKQKREKAIENGEDVPEEDAEATTS